MKIYIAADHAGYELKQHVVQYLKSQNHDVTDHGTHDISSVDFPDYANLVCESLKKDPLNKGILICGSGQGMAIRANKYTHVRAALVYNEEIAKLSREHNDSNIICLGARFCSSENAEKWINIFLSTAFSEGRHRQRVDKISQST